MISACSIELICICVKRSPAEIWYAWQVQSNLERKRSVLCDLMMEVCKEIVIAVANSNVCSCINHYDLLFSWADLLFPQLNIKKNKIIIKKNPSISCNHQTNKQKNNNKSSQQTPRSHKLEGQIKARILFTYRITASFTRCELDSGEVKFLLRPAVLSNTYACLKPYCDGVLYLFLQCKPSL